MKILTIAFLVVMMAANAWFAYRIGRSSMMVDVIKKAIAPSLKEVSDTVKEHVKKGEKVDPILIWRGYKSVVDRIFKIR